MLFLKRLAWVVFVLFYCALSLLGVQKAAAITTCDQIAINQNTANYDPCAVADNCGAASTTTATSAPDQSTAQQVARTFIIGFDAGTPKNVITDLATKYHIGGMYLTGTHDAAAAGFTKDFYDSLNEAAGQKLVIASDEEGVVTRYSYPASIGFTSAATMKDPQTVGQKAGKAMVSNGITTDLAPVLDLRDVGQGLTGRSFSSNPVVVSDKAGAFATGLQSSGVVPIFKHFPGFDSTTSGSTDDTQVVMKGSIAKTVEPYKDLLPKFPKAGVMLSNLYVNALDSANPSSMSSATVDYIHTTLGFKGFITTDDLSVASVTRKAGSLPKAVSLSLQAGVTMPLFGLSAPDVTTAEGNLDKIIAAVQGNSAAMTAIDQNKGVLSSFTGNPAATNAAQPTADSSIAGSCCSAATALSGSGNDEKAWNYFKAKGMGDIQVAAMLGNFKAESGFDPTIVERNSSANLPADSKDPAGLPVVSGWPGGQTRQPGWGLAQWTPSAKIIDLAKQAGVASPIYDLSSQLDIIWWEMTDGPSPTGYSHLSDAMTKQTDLASAVQFFTANFEGPLDPGPNRVSFAQDALKRFGGSVSNASPGGTSDSGGCAISDSTSPNCTSPTGVALIICKAKAYDKASYLYGAGPRDGPSWHKQCPTIGPSCKVDCSLLVTLAVYDAYGVVLPGTDTSGERSDIGKYWKKISFAELQPGDIIQPDTGHVEVVDHKIGQTIYTFGAHDNSPPQADQVSPSHYDNSPGNLYLHYMGPTGGGS